MPIFDPEPPPDEPPEESPPDESPLLELEEAPTAAPLAMVRASVLLTVATLSAPFADTLTAAGT
jgi:hypothetical protein